MGRARSSSLVNKSISEDPTDPIKRRRWTSDATVRCRHGCGRDGYRTNLPSQAGEANFWGADKSISMTILPFLARLTRKTWGPYVHVCARFVKLRQIAFASAPLIAYSVCTASEEVSTTCTIFYMYPTCRSFSYFFNTAE